MNQETDDGEIFDDDEALLDPRNIRVKRSRDSESSDDSYGYHRRAVR